MIVENQRELCRELGISLFTLHYRRHQGWRVPSHGPYDVDALRAEAARMGFATDSDEQADVKALLAMEELRLKKAKADTAEFELAVKRGEWVPVEEHNKKVTEQAAALTKTLEAVPDRFGEHFSVLTDPEACRKELLSVVRYVQAEVQKSVSGGLVEAEDSAFD